jgi:hypothetical protein
MRLLLLLLTTLGCADGKSGEATGELSETGSGDQADSGGGSVDAEDTAPPAPPVPGMPGGLWRDCRGSLGLNVSGDWVWRDADTACVAEGVATLEAGVLSFTVSGSTGCDGVPWWMSGAEGGPGLHTFSTTDIRLTLVPEVALGSDSSASHREKHLYGQLFRERWLLTNDDGQRTQFDACFSPERIFFEGRYRAIDGECDFLSCGGSINEWRSAGAAGIHIWTQCAGDCPCAGVLQTSSLDETTMSGVYGFSNCAMSGTGSFTGIQTPFPSGDAR